MIDLEKQVPMCTGCAACVNICEKDAIYMEEHKDGFKYPVINAKKCSNCRRCLTVCRAQKKIHRDILAQPVIYAMKSKDMNLREQSTSGGIFSELAQCILKRNGYAAGAVYRSDWSVEHRMIHALKDLESLRRSKYQQSNMNLTYREIKSALLDQREVLFCGTPCQIGGLKAFLGKEYEKLYTCDFICRGVSSPKLFAGYIDDLRKKYRSDIKYVWMKNKCNGWHSLTTVIGFENGNKYIKKGADDSYVQMYLTYNTGVRDSCYECQFKGEKDIADITLGDFWGLDGTPMDDNMGTSVVICRTQKGISLINDIKEHVHYQEKKLDDVKKGNFCLYNSIEKKVTNMDMFYEILNSSGYQEAFKWILEKKV